MVDQNRTDSGAVCIVRSHGMHRHAEPQHCGGGAIGRELPLPSTYKRWSSQRGSRAGG